MAIGGEQLFRRQVLESRRQGWLGTVSLAQPLRWRVAAGVALALSAAVLCLLAFGSYAARTPASGELVPQPGTGERLQARLLVPERAIAALAPGDGILLRYRAFPYQRFGHQAGRVAAVSSVAVASAGEDPGSKARFFPVLVDLERQSIASGGKAIPLRAGMRVDADVLGKQRRLYEWVLAPIKR